MSCSRSYYTVLYCRDDGAENDDGDITPIVEDCEYMDDLDDRGIEISCETYSADFVIITEYKGFDPVFRMVFDYQPAEFVSRECRHYVPQGSAYAAL